MSRMRKKKKILLHRLPWLPFDVLHNSSLATINAHSSSVPQLIYLLQVGGGGGAESRLLILIMLSD